MRAHGAKLGVQIFYPEYDCNALNALFDNGEMDKVRARLHHDMQFFVDEVTEKALMQIVEKMCACAVRAQKAGVDGPNVCDAWKMLAGEQTVTGRVAVIGGGLVGCETAEYLAERGCEVADIAHAIKTGYDAANAL